MDATDPEMFESAKMASIHHTILGFEHGYKTVIGERGITLSGGQRQRVTLSDVPDAVCGPTPSDRQHGVERSACFLLLESRVLAAAHRGGGARRSG